MPAANERRVRSGVSAGFARRFAALLYDGFLLAALLMMFTAAALLFTRGEALLHETVGAWVYLYRAGLVGVVAAYFVLHWVHGGQTLGMRAWRLIAVDPAGKPLRYGAALLRFGCALLAWAPAALGVLWLYLDADRLPLHDRLSDTRILHLTSS